MKKVKEEWSNYYNRSQQLNYCFPHPCSNSLRAISKHGSLFLEAGCGKGDICFMLEQQGAKIIGVDLARNAVQQAKQRKKSLGSKAEFLIADVTHLPFKDSCFDGLTSLGVIEHFREISEVTIAFKETRRVLKANGIFFCTIPNIFVPVREALTLFLSKGRIGFYHKMYTASYLQNLAQSTGLSLNAEVIDAWVTFFFFLDGILKRLRVNPKRRFRLYQLATQLPEPFILKTIGGHIVLSSLGEKQ